MGKWFKNDPPNNEGQSKSEADLLVERLGATIDEKLKPLTDKVGTLESKWAKMEEEATKGLNEEENQRRAAAEQTLTPEEKLQNENKKLFLLQVLTNARFTEKECIDEVQGQWPSLVPRIREILGSIPIEDKAKADYPQRCRNAVKLVIGDEAIKGGLRQDRNSGKFLIEDSAASTGGAESPFNDPEFTWTDDRSGKTLTASQQLAKLKIDPKEFEKWMKAQAS